MRPNSIVWLILWGFILFLMISFTLTYLWPLLLVLAIVYIVRIYQTRKAVKEAEEAARLYQQRQQQFYEDAMYQSYRNAQNDTQHPDVIDAEVEEVEEKKVD